MSPRSILPDEFRPWYLLDAAAFVLGVGTWLRRSTRSTADLLALDPLALAVSGVSGLFAVFVLRVTLGNVWGYAAEYANAGGQWSDLPFLATIGSGAAAAVLTYGATTSLGAAAWAAFWTFVVAALVGVALQFAAGYGAAS
ncbi:hypothetical protein [Halobellus sp. EA9]|uniref:hypothetical protein n=1 Tax=Halobellus sp. EA9 TaxID=3421647 RepID=UPI003EBAD000